MLDSLTLLVVMIMTNLLLAVTLWIALHGRQRDGLDKWTASLALQALALALYAGRGNLSPIFSIVAANTLLVWVISLKAAALLEFNQRRLPLRIHVLAGIAAAIVWLLIVDQSFRFRAITGGLIFGSGSLLLALLIDKYRSVMSLQTRLIMGGGFLASACIFFARAAGAWIDTGTPAELLHPNLFQGIVFLGSYMAVIVTSFGFLLMHTERAEALSIQLAATDPLTGALNRRTFSEIAESELELCRRLNAPFSVMMLDLDRFKLVNDTYGHLAGDIALKRFAAIVQGCLRKQDLLVRYGGEEFCVLLPNVSIESAQALAERVRIAVSESPFAVARFSIPITTSAGVSSLENGSDGTLNTVLARADEALYRAKDGGRNRVVALPLASASTAELLKAIERRTGK
jgi:diguanylate cyclase (GGDEF)-like protein